MPKGTPVEDSPYDRLVTARGNYATQLAQSVPISVIHSGALYKPVDNAAAFKAARVLLEMSQASLGEALGLDAPRISGMENGKPIDKRTDLAMRALLAARDNP